MIETKNPVLRPGDTGPWVAFLIRMLNEWIDDAEPADRFNGGYLDMLPLGDVYTTTVKNVVENFQAAHNLSLDGVAGNGETWPVIQDKYPLGMPSTFVDGGDEAWPTARDTVLDIMVINRNRNRSNAEIQRWIDVNNQVCETYFHRDHPGFRCVLGTDNQFDPSRYVPHIIGEGDGGVTNAAGFHTITANGGDIEAWLYTDGNSGAPDITFAHENFEASANRSTNIWGPYFGSSVFLAAFEVCDPVSDRFHTVNGVRVAAWVTNLYLSGDNREPVGSYDSARWFGEPPILSGPKRRSRGGFQVLFNMQTRGVEYRWGDSDAGGAFTRLELPEHVERRVRSPYAV